MENMDISASRYTEFCIHVRYHISVFQMFSRDEKEADVGNRHLGFQSWSLLPWQQRRDWGQKPLLPTSTQLWTWSWAWGVLYGWNLWDDMLCLYFGTGLPWKHSWKARELFARVEEEPHRLELRVPQFSSGIPPQNLSVSYEEIIYPSYSWFLVWMKQPESLCICNQSLLC